MTPPIHSLPFVGAVLLLITLLAMNVTRLRFKLGVRLGDGGDRRLGVAIRAHGNALEHGLLLAVALVLVEAGGLPTPWVVGFGSVILFSRLGHAAGFLRLGFRVGRSSMVVTYGAELLLCAYLVSLPFR